ncbi:hypothetical protein D770_03200 [Flammeovirgaceae bacterium 311]|nr:hypothetical protein D770_03200 [Flammeovirgaceae bacterium 311]
MSALISSSLQYNIFNKGSRAAVGASTRYILAKTWKAFTKKDPPLNPASPGVLWAEALMWGALTGAAAGILGTVVRRLTAEWWLEYQGIKPEEPHA